MSGVSKNISPRRRVTNLGSRLPSKGNEINKDLQNIETAFRDKNDSYSI